MSEVTEASASLHQQKLGSVLSDPIETADRKTDDAPSANTTNTNAAIPVFLLLFSFRLGNALLVKTFFQPDEYFQALEPGWQVAFGNASGAWITWEWQERLRPAFFPYLFSITYRFVTKIATLSAIRDARHAELLIIAPKIVQASFAALGDYYTWKLGTLVYGEQSPAAWTSLALTILNPFHFFVITRTLSNCLELNLTVVALFFWFTSAPEELSISDELEENDERHNKERQSDEPSPSAESIISNTKWMSAKISLGDSATVLKTLVKRHVRLYDLNRLRLCLLLAALACILRITNLFTWLILASFEFFDFETKWIQLARHPIRFPLIRPQIRSLSDPHWTLVREVCLCGSLVLLSTALIDRIYYGMWTFPPFQFLYFNLTEGISTFYGVHDYSWYFLQGLPLMLGTYTIFAFQQVRQHFFQAPDDLDNFSAIIKYEFAVIVAVVPLIFSFIAHKEARFIYPLLPLFHVLAAEPASDYFGLVFFIGPSSPIKKKTFRRLVILVGIVFANIFAAIFATQYHQRAPILVVDYLRHEYETHYVFQPPAATGLSTADTTMTVGFLMPCHSTPWRSHLVHSHIKAWALGCEPPIGLSDQQKLSYRDEADQFYDDPENFLKKNLGVPPKAGSLKSHRGFGLHGESNELLAWDGNRGKKSWPEYLVFFEEKEALLIHKLKNSDYVQCWRGWNAWFHDDWRRQGDIVVFCHHRKPPHLT